MAFLMINTIQVYYIFSNSNFGYKSISLFWIVNTASIVIIQKPFANWFHNKLKESTVYSLGILFIGISLIIPLFHISSFLIILSVIVWTIGEIMFFTICRKYIYRFTNGNRRDSTSVTISYYSVYYGSIIFISVIAYVFGSYITSPYLLILMSMLTIILSFVSYLYFKMLDVKIYLFEDGSKRSMLNVIKT